MSQVLIILFSLKKKEFVELSPDSVYWIIQWHPMTSNDIQWFINDIPKPQRENERKVIQESYKLSLYQIFTYGLRKKS